MTDTDQLPPRSIQAEQAVLGSMLRDNEVIPDVLLALRKEDFYMEANQRIFETIVALFEADKPIDLVTLHQELSDRGQLENVGRAVYLSLLWTESPSSANVLYYVVIVRDKSLLRSLIHASTETLRDAYANGAPAPQIVEEAEQRILSLSELGVQGQTNTLRDVFAETKERIDARMNQTGHASVPTGFIDLDRILCGFQAGELTLLAARPSCGKTALALSIMRNVILNNSISVLFVSLEQSRVEIGERLLCAQTGIDGQKIRSGRLSSSDLDALCQASDEMLRHGQMHIDDKGVQNVARIGANARRLVRSSGIRLLVIDYLQLIEPDDARVSKYEQVSTISRRLKHVARSLNIPILALAQLNRESEARADKRPRMSDLRDSGSLEQDADVVLLLHKKESQGTVDVIDVLVEKQRNGPQGEIPLTFCRPSFRFENYSCGVNPFEAAFT